VFDGELYDFDNKQLEAQDGLRYEGNFGRFIIKFTGRMNNVMTKII
jgi:hypothetical protein